MATRAERLRDILEHPEKHQHTDLNGVTMCSMVYGAIDTRLFQAHEDVSTRRNGGSRCDVTRGPLLVRSVALMPGARQRLHDIIVKAEGCPMPQDACECDSMETCVLRQLLQEREQVTTVIQTFYGCPDHSTFHFEHCVMCQGRKQTLDRIIQAVKAAMA